MLNSELKRLLITTYKCGMAHRVFIFLMDEFTKTQQILGPSWGLGLCGIHANSSIMDKGGPVERKSNPLQN